ncbi:MAG: hypothetical protein ACI9C3_002593, partial [Yoonia sp.]
MHWIILFSVFAVLNLLSRRCIDKNRKPMDRFADGNFVLRFELHLPCNLPQRPLI